MKKLYFLLLFLISVFFSSAQSAISISSGTNLFISSGTAFTAGGLTLTPSSHFTINGMNIEKSATTNYALPTTHITDVYQFSNTSNPFSGTIRFHYADSDLNGLAESSLRLAIYNGSNWQPVSTSSYDDINNFILSNTITASSLRELTLIDNYATLPLVWGDISAWREASSIKIKWQTEQEQNVSHFSIERSTDGINWVSAIAFIAARNLLSSQQYTVTDPVYSANMVYYRIRQIDLDDKYSFSPVVTVAAETTNSSLIVFPNPVLNSFNIRSGIAGTTIHSVQLFNNHGSLVKNWNQAQSEYNITDLPGGLYHLRIQLSDKQFYYFKITKQ